MKIAITSTPWIAIPPAGYGGTERVVQNLVEGLVKKGHDVTLYATGDSKTSAKLEYFYKNALGNNLDKKLNPFYVLDHIHHFYKSVRGKYDIIHDNASDMMVSLYFSGMADVPCIYTVHGVYADTVKDLFSQYGITQSTKQLLQEFKNKPYVSISHKQRDYIPELNYVKTAYNSIILSEFGFNTGGGDYLAWLGRVNYTKGVDVAIQVAHTTKQNLIIAPFVDRGDQQYFDTEVKPHLHSTVESRGEITDANTKSTFMGGAKAFLFPIRWDEPFGIVMIEAMAAGTPVIAFAMGAAPEVIRDGETGFLINPSDSDIRGNYAIKKTGFAGMCEAVERIYSMPNEQYRALRQNARSHVENNFTVDRMVDAYLEAYTVVLSSR